MMKQLGIPLLLSMAIIVIINLTIGSYLEDYEILMNSFIEGLSSNHPMEWLTNADFLLVPFYTTIEKSFSQFSAYACFRLVALTILLTILFYLIKDGLNGKWSLFRAIVASGMLAAVFENLIIINNVRISSLLATSAFLLIVHKRDHISKTTYVWFFSIIVLATMMRIESAMIICAFAFLFSLFFLERRLQKIFICSLFLTFSTMLFYNFMMSKQKPYVVEFHKYEHAIFHNSDLKVADKMNNPSSMSKRELQILGKAFFFMDNTEVEFAEYKDIIKYPNKFDYIFNNPSFLSIYQGKIKDLNHLLFQKYFWLSIPLIFIFILLLIEVNKQYTLRLILFFIIYASFPFVISFITLVPPRFISPYLTIFVLCSLFYFIKKPSIRTHFKFSIIVALLFMAIFSVKYLTSIIAEKNDIENQCIEFSKCLSNDIDRGITPIITHPQIENVISGKIFSKSAKVKWHFSDAYVWSYFPHVRDYNEIFFKESLVSAKDRYEFIANKIGEVYSTEFFMQFVQAYLYKVHNANFEYRAAEICQENTLTKYYIKFVK